MTWGESVRNFGDRRPVRAGQNFDECLVPARREVDSVDDVQVETEQTTARFDGVT
jgi:hypothetical protein